MGTERPDRQGDIEIPQDDSFQRRYWVFQRIGWGLLVLIGVAAMLGLFGARGPLNETVTEGQNLRVEYERFPHAETRTALAITANRPAQADARFEVWIEREYLAALRFERITPEPAAVRWGRDGILLVFETSAPHDSLRVSLHVAPTERGILHGKVRIGPEMLQFVQFVYP